MTENLILARSETRAALVAGDPKAAEIVSPGTQFWPCMEHYGWLCCSADCKPKGQVTK